MKKQIERTQPMVKHLLTLWWRDLCEFFLIWQDTCWLKNENLSISFVKFVFYYIFNSKLFPSSVINIFYSKVWVKKDFCFRLRAQMDLQTLFKSLNKSPLCLSSERQQIRGAWLHAVSLQLQTGDGGAGDGVQHHHRRRHHPTDRN